jgi:two-component system, NtrC family, sensor kinase
MKHISLTCLLAWLLLGSCISAWGQQSTIDSLKVSLTTPLPDTTRSLVLDQLGRSYMYSKPIEALKYIEEGLALAKRVDYSKGIVRNLNRLGSILRLTGNYAKSLNVHLESLKIAEKTNDLDGIARVSNNIGILYSEQNESKKAIEYFSKTKALAQQLNDKDLLQISLTNIGTDYKLLNQLDSARIYTEMAYNMEKVSNRYNYNIQLLNLGNINFRDKKYPLALEYYRLSEQSSKTISDLVTLGQTYYEMALVFKRLDKADSSLIYAKKALETSKSIQNLKNMLETTTFLVKFYKQSNPKIALDYLTSATALKDSMFNLEKVKQIENIGFNEELRQQDLEDLKIVAEQNRRNNIQLIGISIFIITFFLIALLLSRQKVSPRVVEFMGLVSLLLFFEFINLLMHPFFEKITHHTPVLMMLLLVILASILAPTHHKLTHWIKEHLVHRATAPPLATKRKSKKIN